jgi:hypothetical protein
VSERIRDRPSPKGERLHPEFHLYAFGQEGGVPRAGCDGREETAVLRTQD